MKLHPLSPWTGMISKYLMVDMEAVQWIESFVDFLPLNSLFDGQKVFSTACGYASCSPWGKIKSASQSTFMVVLGRRTDLIRWQLVEESERPAFLLCSQPWGLFSLLHLTWWTGILRSRHVEDTNPAGRFISCLPVALSLWWRWRILAQGKVEKLWSLGTFCKRWFKGLKYTALWQWRCTELFL